jgi:hypothetical protein
VLAETARSARAPTVRYARRLPISSDIVAGVVVLGAALTIGLVSAGGFGFTIDEFNADDYGPKALAWYMSGFTDRSQFETVEKWLWGYGPWFQVLTAFVQSFKLADPITIRHALTFLVGLTGVAAILPIARLTVGGWGGVVAIILCLTTGYFYGHLFSLQLICPHARHHHDGSASGPVVGHHGRRWSGDWTCHCDPHRRNHHSCLGRRKLGK